jgi:hypothetical protein
MFRDRARISDNNRREFARNPTMPQPAATRAAHLAWARGRSLEYVARGDYRQAVASMISDLTKYHGADAWSGADLLAIGAQGLDMLLSFDARRELAAWLDHLA